MSLLLEGAIKVSIIIITALVAAALLRRRSAALRHWLLSAAVVSAAVAPFVGPLAPRWSVSAPAALSRAARPAVPVGSAMPSTAAPETASEPSVLLGGTIDPGRLIGWVWAAGAGLSLFVLAAGFWRLSMIATRSHRVTDGEWAVLAADLSRAWGLRRPVRLLQSDHPTLLVTWGFRRPTVILPAGAREWSGDRIRVVLLHELAHIQRGDWLTQLAAECLRAVYWFNPLIWMAAKRLRQESEHACDDAVLGGGVEAPEYATHLLDLARSIRDERQSWFPAPAMARPSSLERRFSAMLNGNTNRSPLTRPARIATTIAVVAITVLVAGLGAAQTFSTFSGSALDPTNRILPGVTVVLINTESRAKYEIQTDRMGRFEFVGLPAGEYSWESRLPGFAALKGVVVVAGRNVQHDLALQIGSLEETISIVGKATDTEPSAARRQTTVDVDGIRRRILEQSVCSNDPIGGNIRPPRKLVDVRPGYPVHLKADSIGGVVVLDARIGTDGDVIESAVVQSAHPDLDLSAVEAVRLWQFTPTILNCYPVEVKMKVTANFRVEP